MRTYSGAVWAGAILVTVACSPTSDTSADTSAQGGQTGDEGHKTQSPATTPANGGGKPVDPTTYTELDITSFEYLGRPINEVLAPFGGERTGVWFERDDAALAVLVAPPPGPDVVRLTVTGDAISAREAVRPGAATAYHVKVPMRLEVGETVDASFIGEIVLQNNGLAAVAHEFTLAELEGIDVDYDATVWESSSYHLFASVWPGGSAGTLRVDLRSSDAATTTLAGLGPTLQSEGGEPPTPPLPTPPSPELAGPPAGYPYIWKLVDYPYALLTWPNGNGCYGYDNGHNPQITGRDHAVDGLTASDVIAVLAALELTTVSHVDGTEPSAASDATPADAGSVDAGSAGTFGLEIVTSESDVCVSTKRWQGSPLDALHVSVQIRATESVSGLDVTLPVELVAFHDGPEIEFIHFASDIQPFSWQGMWTEDGNVPPSITPDTFEEVTGLSRAIDAELVFPLLTGRLTPEPFEAVGQLLIAAPRVGDGDLTPPGESAPVTDLNLGNVETSEIETLFWAIDYSGIDEIYFSGVWSAGP